MPVVEIAPPVTASPCSAAASFSSRPEHASLGGGGPLVGIDLDPLHLGEVDHHPAVRHGAAGDVVAAAADRDLEPFAARERERRHDVARLPAADDHRRPAVDEAVVDAAGRVVAGVLRAEHRPGDLCLRGR